MRSISQAGPFDHVMLESQGDDLPLSKWTRLMNRDPVGGRPNRNYGRRDRVSALLVSFSALTRRRDALG